MQETLMPFVTSHNPEDAPGNIELHLPSSFPRCRRHIPPSMISLPRLHDAEDELQLADAKETLDTLRQYLLVQVHYSKYTRTNVRGQSGNTRLQSLRQQMAAKIEATSERYRRIRQALLSLRSPGDWQKEIRQLKAEDVRPLSESHIIHESGSKALGEGHRTMSWIWHTSMSHLDNTNELNEGQITIKPPTLCH